MGIVGMRICVASMGCCRRLCRGETEMLRCRGGFFFFLVLLVLRRGLPGV